MNDLPHPPRHSVASLFPDARFWFWATLMVAGFVYVAAVLCHRADAFASRHGGHGEILKLLLSVPILYLLGPRHNLRPFTESGAWAWNGLGYALPFFVALHWFYLQRISAINFSLTARDLARMGPVGQIVFLAGGLLILGLVAYHLCLARRERVLTPYLSAFLGAGLLLAGITWVLRGSHYLHLHHYFFFGFFIPFTLFRTPLSLICQAICAGVFVEGVSEWSMAALWYPRG